jgi:hypothetical protein
MTGAEWADIIGASNDAFLRTYSTITQKPIAGTSLMNQTIGADLGSTRMASLGSAGILVVLAVVVGAVLILKK